jgi:hypothetical protein
LANSLLKLTGKIFQRTGNFLRETGNFACKIRKPIFRDLFAQATGAISFCRQFCRYEQRNVRAISSLQKRALNSSAGALSSVLLRIVCEPKDLPLMVSCTTTSLEMPSQVRDLNNLRECSAGTFAANP